MRIPLFLLCGFLLLVGPLRSQQTGKVRYPSLGISFTIPEGWVGQEGDGIYLMGSNTLPGFIILAPSQEQSLDAMRQEARSGLVDQASGTQLQLQSEIVALSDQAIGGEFSGQLEYQPARAYVIGAFNPYGQSITIMAATLENAYSEQYSAIAKKVWRSLEFERPELPPVVDDWQERLNGVRLTYMESYSSIDYSNPGYTSGGGYSKEERIDLCPEGYFNYNDQFNMSASAPSVSGSKKSRQRGGGDWTVSANTAGEPVLRLQFHTGEIYEYVLSREGDKTFLNGKRYYRTWTGDNAPNCGE